MNIKAIILWEHTKEKFAIAHIIIIALLKEMTGASRSAHKNLESIIKDSSDVTNAK